MRNRLVNSLILIGIVVILLVINNSSLKDTIRITCLDGTRWFLTTSQYCVFNFTDGMRKIGELRNAIAENRHLRDQVDELSRQLVTFNEMQKENERLRSLLEIPPLPQFDAVSAQIIGRDISTLSETVVINRGQRDGIDAGTVIVARSGLIGHVVSTGQNHARVLLVTDGQARVCALAQESRESGVIEGTSSHFLKMKYLDVNSAVKVGEIVVTSGFGDIFPKGIPIGTVEMIAQENNNVSLYALVRPFVDFSKLEEVVCLRKN